MFYCLAFVFSKEIQIVQISPFVELALKRLATALSQISPFISWAPKDLTVVDCCVAFNFKATLKVTNLLLALPPLDFLFTLPIFHLHL